MSLKPLNDRVLVKRLESEERTASGLYIPDTAKEKPSKGEVVAVGPGKHADDGKLVPMAVKVGDMVLFNKYAGTCLLYTSVNENDTVSVNELKFSDNDNLASLLINPVEADLFVNLTTIGGVLDANPLETPDAPIMPCIEDVRALNLDTLCGGTTSVGTGGM